MATNPKISPSNTYVFDNEDLEQLDELSLTSIMREADSTLNLPDDDPASSSSPEAEGFVHAPTAESTLDGTSIKDLLEGFGPSVDPMADATLSAFNTEDTGTFASDEVLLSPEEMFSKDELK